VRVTDMRTPGGTSAHRHTSKPLLCRPGPSV